MKNLIDYTKILRSKNAGPLFITFDLIFNTKEDIFKLCHYSNLQLLKAKDNINKRDKLDWELKK